MESRFKNPKSHGFGEGFKVSCFVVNRLKHAHSLIPPIPSLSSPPWSLLFAFYSCTLPWSSHISPHRSPPPQPPPQSTSALDWSSRIWKCVFLRVKSVEAFNDFSRWGHGQVCKGTLCCAQSVSQYVWVFFILYGLPGWPHKDRINNADGWAGGQSSANAAFG